MENTTVSHDQYLELPVFGLGTPLFYITHYSALSSIGISAIFTFGTIIYMIKSTDCKHFWKWPVSSRLVMYLSLSDILRDIVHGIDHCVYVILKRHPPDLLCQWFSYFVHSFLLSQGLVVTVTAIGAFLLVAKGKSFNLGRFDWGLFVLAYVSPAILNGFFLYFGYLGPTGAW